MILTIIGTIGFFVCLAMMYGTNHGIPGIQKFDSGFRLLDMRFRYNHEVLYDTFKSIGTDGMNAYKKYLLLDFCFIACFLVVMWSISLWVTTNMIVRNMLIGLAVARAVFDITENTILIILLNLYPQQNTAIADVCSWATTLKFTTMFLWIGCVVVTLIIRVLAWRMSRGNSFLTFWL